MILTLRVPGVLTPQRFNHFLDCVEAMNDEMVAEEMPSRVLAALNPDVDDDERLVECPSSMIQRVKCAVALKVKSMNIAHLLPAQAVRTVEDVGRPLLQRLTGEGAEDHPESLGRIRARHVRTVGSTCIAM